MPTDLRERRREEVLGHLWESERAGVAPRALFSASLRGVVDDLGWAVRRGAAPAASSPLAWIGVAALLPVLATAVSTFGGEELAGRAERVGMYGSLAMLLVGAALWSRRRG